MCVFTKKLSDRRAQPLALLQVSYFLRSIKFSDYFLHFGFTTCLILTMKQHRCLSTAVQQNMFFMYLYLLFSSACVVFYIYVHHLPSLWFQAWCRFENSVRCTFGALILILSQYCWAWILHRWVEFMLWTTVRSITCYAMVFWSVSDFSYPNHIHVTEVAPLLGRRSSFCFGWSLSSMFACFCRLHPASESSDCTALLVLYSKFWAYKFK